MTVWTVTLHFTLMPIGLFTQLRAHTVTCEVWTIQWASMSNEAARFKPPCMKQAFSWFNKLNYIFINSHFISTRQDCVWRSHRARSHFSHGRDRREKVSSQGQVAKCAEKGEILHNFITFSHARQEVYGTAHIFDSDLAIHLRRIVFKPSNILTCKCFIFVLEYYKSLAGF